MRARHFAGGGDLGLHTEFRIHPAQKTGGAVYVCLTDAHFIISKPFFILSLSFSHKAMRKNLEKEMMAKDNVPFVYVLLAQGEIFAWRLKIDRLGSSSLLLPSFGNNKEYTVNRAVFYSIQEKTICKLG